MKRKIYKYENMVGKKFGSLTLMRMMPRQVIYGKKRAMVEVKCDCGRTEIRILDYLLNVKKATCRNCREESKKCNTKNAIYPTWVGIIGRCYRKSSPSYKWYGQKGIKVCEEWRNYKAFIKWAESNGWYKGCNVDRIDREKDYSPSNCRIVSAKENQNNRSDNIMITYNGETRSESEWERILGFPRGRIQGRRRLGMNVSDMLLKGKFHNDGSRKLK